VFEQGRVYRRDEVHHAWNGTIKLQPQGGILTPVEVPLIVVVTGEEGREYGYLDFRDDDGVFHYYGAGRKGHMTFVRGNRALRDHLAKGEDVHLFEQESTGLRYVGQVDVAGYYERDDVPDATGAPRHAIIFELVSHEVSATTPPPTGGSDDRRWTMPMDQLRDRASRTLGKQPDARTAKRTSYERSEDLKIYVRRRANGFCEGCETPAPFVAKDGRPYLEPHHVRRLSDGGPDDYHHVITLCPTCHRRVHHGADGDAYNGRLRKKLREIEP
jgi:5-methylcytosine-specific restriction protein A